MTALVQAESFLRNRKWIVGSSTNLREALAYIIQKQPQYVMVSADHPNRKVRVLPKMLVQAFPCRVIAFAEKGSSQSTKVLHEMALEYNIYPPVSGPSIERMVLKIRREDELRAQQSEITGKSSKSSASSAVEGSMTFRGDAPSADALKSSFEQARAALTQLVSSDAVDEAGTASLQAAAAASSGSSAGSGSGVIIQQGIGMGTGGVNHISGSGLGSASSATQSGPSSGSNSGIASAPAGSHIGSGFGGSSGLGNDSLHGRSSGSASDAGENFHEGGSDWESSTARQGSVGRGGISGDESSGGESGPSAFHKKGHTAPIMEFGDVRKSSKEYKITTVPTKNSIASDSIIIKGTEQALEQTVQFQNPEQANLLRNSSNIACILVKGEKFSGYLVCALGENRRVDQELIETIQKKLFSFLKANGENLKEEDCLQLKVQQVDFTDWALEKAQFLKKSIHDGDEIAMAFFPHSQAEVELGASASNKMVKINLRDLKPDAPLEFDLYIFMPQNNKYLLYTPKGKPFSGQQQGRLAKKGVTHMHLRKEAVVDVKRYSAQNFLNESIATYREEKKTK